MFSKSVNKLPVHTDKLNFGFDKDSFSWQDISILSKGIVKETINEDDDIITITKEFVAKDNSYRRKETITLSEEQFEEYKKNSYSKEEILKEINDLEKRITFHSEKQEYEECASLTRQKENLKKLLII